MLSMQLKPIVFGLILAKLTLPAYAQGSSELQPLYGQGGAKLIEVQPAEEEITDPNLYCVSHKVWLRKSSWGDDYCIKTLNKCNDYAETSYSSTYGSRSSGLLKSGDSFETCNKEKWGINGSKRLMILR